MSERDDDRVFQGFDDSDDFNSEDDNDSADLEREDENRRFGRN